MKKHSGTCSACGKETTVYENPTGEELCKPCVLESVKHGGEDFGPGEKAEYLTDILGADYKAKGFAGMEKRSGNLKAHSGTCGICARKTEVFDAAGKLCGPCYCEGMAEGGQYETKTECMDACEQAIGSPLSKEESKAISAYYRR